MKVSTAKDRLKEIMSERNLRPVDILRQSEYYQKELNISLNKVNLSHYLTGRNEPNKEKIRLLAKTLKVSEAWLSGFDVPKDLVLTKSETLKHFDMVNQSDKIALDVDYLNKKYPNDTTIGGIISNYDKLEEKGRQSLLQYSDMLLEASYQNDNYDIVATMVDHSMEPLYKSDERLMVTFGYDFKIGDIYLVEYKKDILIRKLFYNEYNIKLVPLNEKYPVITVNLPLDIHFKIIGKIIGKITSP